MNRRVLSKTFFSFAFCSLFLLSAKQMQACTGMDVVLTKITFTSITSSDYTYTYEIKNLGTQSVPLNQISLQNYVATDAQGANLKAAGGSSIVLSSNTDAIAPGATYTGTLSAYPNAVGNYPKSSYPYLIVDVSIYPGTECDNTNNRLAAYIELTTTGIKSQRVAKATILWSASTKSFSVSNWSGNNANNLEYSVITISGNLVASGKTTEGQSIPLHALQDGMYVIFLSDGVNVYSEKIIY